MGSCMSGNKQKSSEDLFHKDNNLLDKTEIYQPITTTLFNTLRKHNDLIVIFADSVKAKEFSGVALDQIKSLPQKSLKMMYSFKRLIVVAPVSKTQKDVEELTKMATISSIYIVQPKFFFKFQNQYPLFTSFPQIISNPTPKIPLMVFHSTQLIKAPQKTYEIFIHSLQQRDQKVYSYLKIQAIIQPKVTQEYQDQIKFYIEQLKKNGSSRVVLLHDKSLSQSDLMQILSQYLIFLYEVTQISVKAYLARTLPKVAILPSFTASNIIEEVNKLELEINANSNLDEFHKAFRQLINQSNLQKTERSYNLLIKLVANIIQNPDAQNYRKVKGANKQMQELLTRTKSGVQLLKLAGFRQKTGFWINQLQIKYLKVLRTDMDLAYRKAGDENDRQKQKIL